MQLSDTSHLRYDVGGDTDHTTLLSDRPQDRLANPPRGVSAEFEPPPIVEFLDSPHQAGVSFLDQVGQAESPVLILLRQ